MKVAQLNVCCMVRMYQEKNKILVIGLKLVISKPVAVPIF